MQHKLNILERDRPFIIAEAGTCHAARSKDTRVERALRYVCAAADAGADAVKFQWFCNWAEPLFCPFPGDKARQNRWRQSALDCDDWAQIKEAADLRGLVFLASAFQEATVKWLSELDIPATKVASRAAKSFPYDEAPAPFLISTGLPDWPERKDAIYLECEANYPSTARWTRDMPGFSDHSGTPWRAIDAISRGCKLIEVHYYVDGQDAGPDYPASLSLDQLRLVCETRDGFAGIRPPLQIADLRPLQTAGFGIKDLGDGWYELSDGSRIRGEQTALHSAAMAQG